MRRKGNFVRTAGLLALGVAAGVCIFRLLRHILIIE